MRNPSRFSEGLAKGYFTESFNAVCFFSPTRTELMFESAVATHVIFLAPLDSGKFSNPNSW